MTVTSPNSPLRVTPTGLEAAAFTVVIDAAAPSDRACPSLRSLKPSVLESSGAPVRTERLSRVPGAFLAQ